MKSASNFINPAQSVDELKKYRYIFNGLDDQLVAHVIVVKYNASVVFDQETASHQRRTAIIPT